MLAITSAERVNTRHEIAKPMLSGTSNVCVSPPLLYNSCFTGVQSTSTP